MTVYFLSCFTWKYLNVVISNCRKCHKVFFANSQLDFSHLLFIGVCKEKLDKCSAKVYHGEIYCEKCYKLSIDGTCSSSCSPHTRPCRVVSSPSSICLPKSCRIFVPKLDCGKKCNIWFPDDGRVRYLFILKQY